ncbi:MAG: 30S ribosomal protein S20 [Treponema sp.]|nr:30S ribosomal protein S20 [Treponema sp.]
MANKKSADKRYAQSETRRMRNKAVKSQVHTALRKFTEAVQKKDQNLSSELLKALQSELDNAYRKGVIKQNACARKKSRMFKLFNVTFAAN